MDKEKLMKTVGENVRRLRKAYGKTQTQVAKELGIDRTHLCKIETGDGKVQFYKLKQIADYFGQTIDSLCVENETTSEQSELVIDKEITLTPKHLLNMNKMMFPVFEKAELQDDDFQYAVKKHNEIFQHASSPITEVKACWDRYAISYEKNDNLFAMANSISLYLFVFSVICGDEEVITKLIEYLKDTRGNFKIEKIFKLNVFTAVSSNSTESLKKDIARSTEKEMLKCLKILKEDGNFIDFVD